MILIFTLQREELGFKDIVLGPSPPPQGPGYSLFSCASKDAVGWEDVGPSTLHGEHCEAPSPGGETPLAMVS